MGGYAPLALVTGSGGSAAIYWVHGNHMGVPLVTTDASGAVATPTGYTVLGFPGQTRTLADLYYNRYRDYDSSLGRYIQADPIGLGGGNNPYLYAGANPLRYTDPSGKFAQALVGLCVANLEICAPAIIIGGGILCYYYCPRLPLPCPELTADDPSGPDFATSGGNGGPTKRPPPPAPNAPPGSTWAASPGAPMGPGGPNDWEPDGPKWGPDNTPSAVGSGTAGPTITFGHGGRHLAGTGLSQTKVEGAITNDIRAITSSSTTTTGEFWGQVEVNGQRIFYRAWTRPDGVINVGTYTVGAP